MKKRSTPDAATLRQRDKARAAGLAAERGPSDATQLHQLADFAEYQQDIGDWKAGYLTAARLRMLAEELPRPNSSYIAALRRAIGDLAAQVEAQPTPPQIVFVLVRDDDVTPDTLGIELGMELVLLLADIT